MNEKLFNTGFDFGPELGALIMWLYPERHREMGVFWDGQKCVCQSWPDDLEIPTDDEIEAAYQTYLLDYPVEKLEGLRQSLRSQAEDTFYRLASEKTGEPINALIIQEWQAKEMLVKQWVAAGKPVPLPDNDYALAYYEAEGDPDKDASQLMEAWLVNATNWRMLNIAYIAWRQGFRTRVKAAKNEDELNALRYLVETGLKELMKL